MDHICSATLVGWIFELLIPYTDTCIKSAVCKRVFDSTTLSLDLLIRTNILSRPILFATYVFFLFQVTFISQTFRFVMQIYVAV